MLRNNKGFTLIELMIVVAIIGILAAIAIPNFIAMQMRAKRAELPTNVDGIRTAQKAYHAEWDKFTSATAAPTGTPLRTQEIFTPTIQWALLGWQADGKVRGKYQTTASNQASSQSDDFLASGHGDVDGDSTPSLYTANRALKSKMDTANNVY